MDFSANGDLDGLVAGTTALTEFVYTIEGGDDAVLTVEVFGDTFGGGGGVETIGIAGPTEDDVGAV